MRGFFDALNRVFDLFFWPFEGLHPLYGLAFASVVVGMLIVLAFRYTSNQKEIRGAKNRLQAHILEIRLFQEQPRVVLRAYGQILRSTGVYLGYSLKPLAALLLPLAVIVTQLDMRFGWVPPQPGDTLLLKVKVAAATPLDQIALLLPDGLELTSHPLRVPEEREVDWRIQVQRPGEHRLQVLVGGQSFDKQLTATWGIVRLSAARGRGGFVQWFLHPGEPPLPSQSPIEVIQLAFQPREISIGSLQVHWLIIFFALSLVSGFILKGPLGTEV